MIQASLPPALSIACRHGRTKCEHHPRYAARLSDLERWHVLTAVCGACRHRRHMRIWQLLAERPAYTHLSNVEA